MELIEITDYNGVISCGARVLRKDDRLRIRISHELKVLIPNSSWVIEAIEEKLIKEGNKEFIGAEIRKHKDIINNLNDSLKGAGRLNKEAQHIMEGLYPEYKNRVSMAVTEKQMDFWITERVKPSLNKVGYRGSIEDIIKLFNELNNTS